MAWGGSAAISDTNKTSNTQTNASGQTTPLLSNDWLNAYKNSSGNLNGTGATGTQQTALDWASNNLKNNPAMAALYNSTENLQTAKNQIGGQNALLAPLTTQANYQSAGAPQVGAASGASLASQYYNPFMQNVINTSVDAYNTNADRTLNAMRAGRDASGAFGDRSAVADAQYSGDATKGLGSLVSGLYSQGFDTAQGLGQQDANRLLNADTTNAANTLNNNQFNVNANYQGDQQKIQAIGNQTDNIVKQAGITKDQAAAIVQANGINVDAATALFTAGQITQEQLNQITQLAQSSNGSQFQGNTGSSTNSNEVSGNVKTDFSI